MICEIPGSRWEYGFDLGFLQDICEDWASSFDWQDQLESLARLPHYQFTSRGSVIHFIHVRGRAAGSTPLILTHGWPGSFLEMLPILPFLALRAALPHSSDALASPRINRGATPRGNGAGVSGGRCLIAMAFGAASIAPII